MTCLLRKCSQLSWKLFISTVLRLWWAQDGTPPHRSRDVKTVLIEMFNNHVTV